MPLISEFSSSSFLCYLYFGHELRCCCGRIPAVVTDRRRLLIGWAPERKCFWRLRWEENKTTATGECSKLVSSPLRPVSDTTTVLKMATLPNYAFRRQFSFRVGCVRDDSELLRSRVYCYVTWSRQLSPLLLFTCADAPQRQKLSPYLHWRRSWWFSPLMLCRSDKLTFSSAAIQFDMPRFGNIPILLSFVHPLFTTVKRSRLMFNKIKYCNTVPLIVTL